MVRPQFRKRDNRQRLQKVLAAAGVGSRRECEDLIVEGRVEVDDSVADKLGTRVDPESQKIRVDGVPLRTRRRRYFAVHKPPGVLSTSKDPWGRARVIDLVAAEERLFAIGRLDKDSSGLILVTNDGELANQLTHPRYGVNKTYQVTVLGYPTQEVLGKVRRGVILAEGAVKPELVSIKKRVKNTTLLEIVLKEGRNREIRRMLARYDHKVLRLHRIAIGSVRLGMLPRGEFRELTREEVKKLRECCRQGAQQETGQRPSARRRASAHCRQNTSSPGRKPKRTPRKTGTVLGVEARQSGSSSARRKKTKKAGASSSVRSSGKGRRR